MACEVGGHTGSHGRLTRILVRMMAKRVDVVATLSCPPGATTQPVYLQLVAFFRVFFKKKSSCFRVASGSHENNRLKKNILPHENYRLKKNYLPHENYRLYKEVQVISR